MPDMHTIGLKLNRLILAAIAKGAQTQHDIPKEDRITDAELDAMKAEIMSLVSAPVRAEAAKTEAEPTSLLQKPLDAPVPNLALQLRQSLSATADSGLREAEPTPVGSLADLVKRIEDQDDTVLSDPHRPSPWGVAYSEGLRWVLREIEAMSAPVSAVEPLKALDLEHAARLLRYLGRTLRKKGTAVALLGKREGRNQPIDADYYATDCEALADRLLSAALEGANNGKA